MDSIKLKSVFVEHIKSMKFGDKKLNALLNNVLYREVVDATFDVVEVFWIEVRFYDPLVVNLIQGILEEAYGSTILYIWVQQRSTMT